MKKATTVILLLACAYPLSAAGAPVNAPPGNSEADQYFESIPTPEGAQSPDSSKNAGDAVKEGKLTPAGAQALREQGSTGRAIAELVAQTAPSGAAGTQSGKDGGAADGEGSTNGVSFAVPGEGGMGLLFPLLLAVTGAVALAFVVDRRRRSTPR
jgi:hypothetical protein